MTITYVRPWPTNPPCQHCGETLDYWVPGLPFNQHAHDKCRIDAFVRDAMKSMRRALAGVNLGGKS